MSSASDTRTPAARPVSAPKPASVVELSGVSLRFVSYSDKYYSLKRAFIDLFLQCEQPNQRSTFWALTDINLRIEKGERVGILGPNGAGKSTLLRVLSRIYPPTTGRIAVNGRVAPLIDMGAGFNFELSGEDNIFLNGAMLGMSRNAMKERLDRIWDFSGLRDFADLPLKYYSSGMVSRLAFSVATEVQPDILLIDETLSPGDATFVDKAKERITGLIHQSNVVILVSHDMNSLRKMCTRGIWLDQGRIVGDGPIDDITDRYLHYVQEVKAGAA